MQRLFALNDGDLVLIREIRADDRWRLAEGLAQLSEETIYKRFLSPKPRLSAGELTYLTEVDFADHYALVAMSGFVQGRIVASARWVRLAGEPESAEVAVVVADPLQGKGLGRELGTLLAAAARERGIKRFTATMLAGNEPAHRLFEHISSSLHVELQGGVHQLVAELAA